MQNFKIGQIVKIKSVELDCTFEAKVTTITDFGVEVKTNRDQTYRFGPDMKQIFNKTSDVYLIG